MAPHPGRSLSGSRGDPVAAINSWSRGFDHVVSRRLSRFRSTSHREGGGGLNNITACLAPALAQVPAYQISNGG